MVSKWFILANHWLIIDWELRMVEECESWEKVRWVVGGQRSHFSIGKIFASNNDGVWLKWSANLQLKIVFIKKSSPEIRGFAMLYSLSQRFFRETLLLKKKQEKHRETAHGMAWVSHLLHPCPLAPLAPLAPLVSASPPGHKKTPQKNIIGIIGFPQKPLKS